MYELKPFLHTSSKIGPEQKYTSWYMPIAADPVNKNAITCVDLSKDISPLFDLTSDEIKERLYTRHDELKAEGKLPIPVKQVHINKCPVVAPAKTLTPERAGSIGIDREFCLANWKLLKEKHQQVNEKLTQVFVRDFGDVKDDPEHALYSGSFFSYADKDKMAQIHQMPAEQLGITPFNFSDKRLDTLLFRYRARNFPHTLDANEQLEWQQYCHNKLNNGEYGLTADSYIKEIQGFAITHAQNEEKMAVLESLEAYLFEQQSPDFNEPKQKPQKLPGIDASFMEKLEKLSENSTNTHSQSTLNELHSLCSENKKEQK